MDASSEYVLATRLVATAATAITANPNGSVDQPEANRTTSGLARTVPQLLVLAKPASPPLSLLLFVIIAFVLTIFTLILAGFDATRGFLALKRRAARKKQIAPQLQRNRAGHEVDLLEEEDAPRMLGSSWRPFYSTILFIASICQATYILIFLQGSRGLLPRQIQFSSENVAFTSSVLAALFLVLAAMPSSPASRSRLPGSVSGRRSTVWHYLILALISLSPALVIMLMILGTTRYTKAWRPLQASLRSLLAKPNFCATQSSASNSTGDGADADCSVFTIAFLLQDQAGAAKANVAFKGTVLLCVAFLIAVVAHEALRALRHRQAALTDVHMQLEQARLENEDLGGGLYSDAGSVSERSGYSGVSAPSVADSRKGSLFRSGMSAEAERDYLRYLQGLGIHSLYRRDTVYSQESAGSSKAPSYKSTSSAKGATAKPVRKPPPSYRDTDSFSNLDDAAAEGVALDTSDAIGRALQRQYGSVDLKRAATKKSSKKASEASLRDRAAQGARVKSEDRDDRMFPGYLNAHITKPEAAAMASHDDEEEADKVTTELAEDRGLTRMKTTTRLGRMASLARARSLRIDEIDVSKIVPSVSAASSHAKSGRAKPKGGRPMERGASSDSSYSSSEGGGSPSRGSSYSRWSRSDRSYPSRAPSPSDAGRSWYTNGSGSRHTFGHFSRGTTGLGLFTQPHPGSIALTLSAAAASSSAALARTAPLRSRMRLNRAMALGAVALFLFAIITMLAIGDDLELGMRPQLSLFLTGLSWFLETGLHACILGLLIFRGSGAVEEIPLSWGEVTMPDLEEGRIGTRGEKM
ncbi:hypothetical protein OC845_002515 [Tilletia horrida]|nr:hypothetical protein OC845_002515 [Tilletia horrida]